MDVIKIKDKTKGIIEMEVVLTYKFEGKDYVIYKDKEDVLYIAKYNLNNDKLDTNLSESEIKYGEKVLSEVLNCAKGQ